MLPLTSDLVFKAVFGRDTKECKQLLIAMLNLILDRKQDPSCDLIYKNPFSYAEQPGSKQIVMDIKVELQSGEWVDVEMQVCQLGDYISRRLLTEQLQSAFPLRKDE